MENRASFCFVACVLLCFTTGLHATDSQKNVFDGNPSLMVNGIRVTRKGLINQISQAVEGVVAVTEDILNVILSPLKQLIKLDQEAIINNPHAHDVAKVRIGGPLCKQEMAFRARRFAHVKAAQEKMLNMKLSDDDVLEIAFCGSGGGVRAMTCSLGSCVGADKIGLLDSVMYMSGLSGSTWFLAPWISSGLPLREYKEHALQAITRGLSIQAFSDLNVIFDAFWVKFAFNQHLNVVDIYGSLLANNFLRCVGKPQNMVYLSDQRKVIAHGDFPMPIYTAVFAEQDTPNYWFEFTPFEVGARHLGGYIPSWSFGRKFKRGVSRSCAPEQSLGFMMGMFGSAFAASFEEGYHLAIKNLALPKFLQHVPGANKIFEALKKLIGKMSQTDLGELRLAWAQVFNFSYKMKGFYYYKNRDMKLVDAGVSFSDPIFVTYRRPPHGEAPDVIFILAAGSANDETLHDAEAYARRNDLPFPEIDYTDLEKHAMTTFGNALDLKIPLVIFMPRIIDTQLLAQYAHDPALGDYAQQLQSFDIEQEVKTGFAHTFNFNYTRKQAELLMHLTEFNMRAVAQRIKDILEVRISAKRMLRPAS